jgi:hypothetical protein
MSDINQRSEKMIDKDTLDKWLDVLNYWFEHIEDYAERYPDMAPMVKKFDKMIDEMYNICIWKK